MNVVVVESPAKAKTINRYLGSDYRVLASYGHVRDLPAKDGSVDPEQEFAMTWEVSGRAEKHLKEIAAALKGAERLVLATDPDREGEAISWHIVEELARRHLLDRVEVQRVVFNEVTKSAVVEAFDHPRELNRELIEAYLARRALDYLVGFTLSPVLWRKLPGSRSAGRVQSVALRLVCEREAEIEAFRQQEYWSVTVALLSDAGQPFEARLTHLEGRKLGKFDIADEGAAMAAKARLEAARDFVVAEIERKSTRRNPMPPFTTSTLQQEASRKLGFGASKTMSVAQRLYEGLDLGGETVGLITYMRTDGVQISREAMTAARDLISGSYGADYLPSAPRIYRSKAKNAQEAHEAIRPTDLRRRPGEAARYLGNDEARLYELIWQRTVASQMEAARFEQVAADIAVDATSAALRATGQTLTFDGFLKLYQEGRDEAGENGEDQKRLPPLAKAEALRRQAVTPQQHFTQPPPRYSEASLVKRLEELGIGRPSTYASILEVLKQRDYVRLEKRRFVPEDRGRLVTAFLTNFFERYVEYGFTADMEGQLDEISGGRKDWKLVLSQFWETFREAVAETQKLRIGDVITVLDDVLGDHFFPLDPQRPEFDPRRCPACGKGRLSIKLGRSGGFIGCTDYPECRYTRPLAVPTGEEDPASLELASPRILGRDPQSGQEVTLRRGPFGIYVQLGEPEGKAKPKRVSLPANLSPSTIDLETALALLALPREVGRHPEEGVPVLAGIGRYGPYLKLGPTYCSLPPDDDVLTIGLNRAVTLLAEAPRRRGGNGKPLGEHPEDGAAVTLHSGRYGPYVKHGRLNASLPRGADPETFTLSDAIPLLAAAAEKAKTKKPRGGNAAKSKAKPKTKAKVKAKAKSTTKKSAGGAKKTAAKRKTTSEGASTS